jgi:hypothetical protein
MPITVTITSIKPAGVDFFHDVSEDNYNISKSIGDWTAEQPGFVSQTYSKPDENTRIITYVFDSIENYGAWSVNRSALPNYNTIIQYYLVNGITTTRQEVIS